ncbi:MFS transporter [Novosphingobium sp.]|uniref:MFS transporter n=1 Tax=Novosphingobium sp. TaxID=1874826 RepID=UPI002618B53F|nr:MFS transporter [Novosphingobium sp.]
MATATNMSMEERSGWDEFSGRKLLVLSALLGLTTSMNAMMIYALGSFIAPLQAEFGWARGDISFAVSVLTFAVFLFGPVAGRLCDRFGAALVGAASLLCYGLAVILMTFVINSLASLWAAFFIVAMLGVGSTPIVLVRPIAANFDRRRGLALGIALTGAGLAGFWVPNLATEVIASHGWRAGYWTIGALAMCAAPIAWFGFGPSERRAGMAALADAPKTGLSFQQARGTSSFWFVSALAFAMALGVGGMIVHLIPLFQDMGADTKAAARLASVLGIASAAGRLLIGLCLDRFAAAWVTTTVLVMGAAGLAILLIGSLSLGLPAVILIGLLLGAELDLLAYFASRQFGQRAFGAIYGWFYAMYSLGFGLSPFVIGNLYDRFGSYDAALMGSIACLALAALATLGVRTRPHPQAFTA